MAKYPLLYGNTNSRFDVNNSSGESLSASEGIFDVYTYKNAGINDNAERSTAIVILRNAAAAGTTTELLVHSILLSAGETSNPYTDFNITLDPIVFGSVDMPFIGSPEQIADGVGNKVSSVDSTIKPGDTSVDSGGGLEDGWVNVTTAAASGTQGSVINKEDLDTANTEFRTIPIHSILKIKNNVIPSASYCAFLVSFQPTENVPINTIEATLRITTNAGNFNYPLQINSYDEIIMAMNTGTCAAADIFNFSNQTFTEGYTYDEGVINLGLVGTARTANSMLETLNYQSVKISDISTDSSQSTYKWMNSVTNGTVPTYDGTQLSLAANSSPSGSTDFDFVNLYSEANATNATGLNGASGSYYDVAGRHSLVQYFFPTPSITDGTYNTADFNQLLHFSESDVKRTLFSAAQYISQNYNNTDTVIEEEPYTDDDPKNNQWIAYTVTYGVHNRITFDEVSLDSDRNRLTYSAVGSNAYPVLDSDVNLSERGTEYSTVLNIRWNNYTQGANATLGQAVTSFTFEENNDAFRMTGVNCPEVGAHSFTSGGVPQTSGSFSEFSLSGNHDTSLTYKFAFEMIASDIYNLGDAADTNGVKNAFITPYNEPLCGQYKAILKIKSDDSIWKCDGTFDYPGVDQVAAAAQNWDAYFHLKSSYLTILPLTGNMDLALTGLGTPFSKSFVWMPVTNWFGVSGTAIYNTSANWDASHRYSGNGGSTFRGGSTSNTAKSLALSVADSVVTWGDIIAMEDYTKQYNNTRKYIRDKNAGTITEFKPLDSLMSMNTPAYNTTENRYESYVEFNLFAEGDDGIYIHSITSETGSNQMLDFDNTTPLTNLAGSNNYGYKPSSASNDAVMFASIKYCQEDWRHTITVLPTLGQDPSTYNGSMCATYRDQGSNAPYILPKILQHLGNSNITEAESLVVNPLSNQTSPDIEGSSLVEYGMNDGASLNSSWIFEKNAGSPTNTPMGNPKVRLRMSVDPVGTLDDYGAYYSTLKIVYYKNERANRVANSTNASNEYAIDNTVNRNQNIILHEMSVVVKMTLEAASVLAVTDTENEEFTTGSTINLGNLNLG
tara:strand:- start:8920 stop:12117 length:3198 start_codon:yes stop_codon:yes gene_type:complete